MSIVKSTMAYNLKESKQARSRSALQHQANSLQLLCYEFCLRLQPAGNPAQGALPLTAQLVSSCCSMGVAPSATRGPPSNNAELTCFEFNGGGHCAGLSAGCRSFISSI